MKQFLVISSGPDASSAIPILATSDPGAISAALVALVDRIVPRDDQDERFAAGGDEG